MSSNLTLELFSQVRRMLNLMAIHELRSVGLGFKQAVIMNYLDKNSHCSVACLAKATSTDPAAATRAVDSLVKQGWVRRLEDAHDRRKWVLCLTPEGKKQTKPILKTFGKVARRLEEPLTTAEIRQFRKTMNKIIDSFNREQNLYEDQERRDDS